MIGYTQEGGRTILVCIDSYDRGVPMGRFYNPHLCAGVRFHSLTEFMKRITQALDLMEGLERLECAECLLPSNNCKTGELATFAIRILFRQNGSWQGLATWLDKRREYSFKSALELFMILSDALEVEQAG